MKKSLIAKKYKQKPEKGSAGSKGSKPQVAAAAAYASGQVGKAPTLTFTKDSCRIQHRELVGSVTGSAAFTVASSFALNPGLIATFPWLSVVAQAWEQYRFNKLRFCYYTRTASTTPGSVLLVPDYDAADSAPATEQIASTYEDTAEDAPWKDICCTLRVAAMSAMYERHFVRSLPLASNLDIKTYDVGILHLATIDGTAVAWGKLWVEYDVTFYVPQLPASGPVQLLGGVIVSGGTQSAANPLGTTATVDAQAAGIAVDAASVITFSLPGLYVFTFKPGGTVISGVTVTAGAGATVTASAPTINAGATEASWIGRVLTTIAGATVAVTMAATTVTSGNVTIGQAPPSSLS